MMNIRLKIPLVNFDNADFPLVMATFVSNSGVMVGGAFMVDTASRHNILNQSVLPVLKEECLDYTGEMTLTSFSGQGIKGKELHLDFCLGKSNFHEQFYAAEGLSFDSVFSDHVILGILGVEFLAKYGLVLDFRNASLYSSYARQNDIAFKESLYIFPLEYGFSKYGMPIVGLLKDKKEYLFLIDSGSNLNTTTLHVLQDASLDWKYTGKKSSITSVAGTHVTSAANVKFNLMGIGTDNIKMKLLSCNEEFHVIDNCRFILDGNDHIPPISGILGTEFLKNQKWVIDFDAGMAFSL